MDPSQGDEDAVGGHQSGRASFTVSSHVSMKNLEQEPNSDGHQGIRKGQGLSYTQ